MTHHLVLRVIAKLLIPFILLFALYVQFHGDFGPGGGFQAGVIFASAFILYALVFGVDVARKVAPDWAVRSFIALGALIYGGIGLVSMFRGGNYLDYSVLSAKDFFQFLKRSPPGDRLALEFLRDGRIHEVELVLR